MYNCGGGNEQSSSSTANSSTANSTTKVKVAMKPDRGDWISNETGDDGLPMWSAHDVKRQMIHNPKFAKYSSVCCIAMGDYDNDEVDDLFVVVSPQAPGQVGMPYGVVCDVEDKSTCYSQAGTVAVFNVKQRKAKDKNGEYTSATYTAREESHLLFNNNPLDMAGTGSARIVLMDFNGDGKLDIMVNGDRVDALSLIVHRSNSIAKGRELVNLVQHTSLVRPFRKAKGWQHFHIV